MRNCVARLDWRFIRKIQIGISRPRSARKMDLESLRIIVQTLKPSLLHLNLFFRGCSTNVEHIL